MTSRERTDSQTTAVPIESARYENAELRREIAALKLKLAQAEEQQSATREILRGISGSPADLQRLLHVVAERAAYLCDGNDVVIVRVEGDVFRLAAHHGTLTTIASEEPMPIQRDLASGRAIIDRRVVHIPDVLTEPDSDFAGAKAYAARFGYRTNLAVPMLRKGTAIGAMVIRRVEVRPFSDDQIELLKAFADQAVVAIENTQLLTELQDRLEQQTFTSEILRVISQSQRDVGPVFEAIAANARNLCNASTGLVYTFDGELIHVAAVNSVSPGAVEALRRTFPMPPGRGGVVARSILTGAVVYVRDVEGDPEYGLQDLIQAFGLRSVVSVPMLRDGKPIGAICVTGVEPAMFTQRQVALLQTFADQAVIAIENTRLFDELQERLTATSDILRVISQSQRDVQPVFEAIAASARKLCRSTSGWVHTFDGHLINVAAVEGLRPEGLELARRMYPMPPNRGGAPGRAILSRTVCYIPDIRKDSEYRLQAFAQEAGFLCALSVPMLREGRPIGTVTVAGAEPAMFTERQIAMLQTFADQAVIAIENTRLFNETQEALHKVEERTTELTEALEHQTAISQVLRVLSESPTDVSPVLQVILDSATRLVEPQLASILRYDGRLIHVAANHNWTPEMTKEASALFPMPADERSIAGRAILARRTIAVEDLLSDPQYALAQIGKAGRRTISAPMLKGGVPLGAITVAWSEPGQTPQRQIDLLNTFADQAVIAIENTRLFNELQERLEQQTATSEILRVISQSQRDVQPVFDVIAANARKLCGSTFATLYTYDSKLLHIAAMDGFAPEGVEAMRQSYPSAPDTGTTSARAILTGAVSYIPDVREDPEFQVQSLAEMAGFRSSLSVPMLRDGCPIGAVSVAGAEPAMFTEGQIAMLKTFADQAVIAIENTRLFNELRRRTAELGRSVEELKALGEVGTAVSSTLDVDTVLTTIVTHATQLSGTQSGVIYDYDEVSEELHARAAVGLTEEITVAMRRDPLRKGEGVTGGAIANRRPVQVADITTASVYESRIRPLMLESGFRAVLAVPLIREDQVLGALVVSRKRQGEFSPQVVDLLTTFASQSALAMQNARLFQQLQVASKHKSQFLANMSHELRTPLNAILGYTELIVDHIYGEVPEKISEVLDRVQQSGRHLLGLINDVLDLSKIEAGQLTLSLGDFAFSSVVQAVVNSLGSLAAEKHLQLTVDVAADLPLGQGDERRITQVLLNLVGNAIKFTEKGEVAVRVSASEGAFLVAVADSGPGIKKEDQEKIFEEFQQSESAITKSKTGTGLGLAIAKRIVELHNGRIWVESVLGQGSTFFVSLPIRAERREVAP